MSKDMIWIDDEHGEVDVPQALELITDEWIDQDLHCNQTMLDLRYALERCLRERDEAREERDHMEAALEQWRSTFWDDEDLRQAFEDFRKRYRVTQSGGEPSVEDVTDCVAQVLALPGVKTRLLEARGLNVTETRQGVDSENAK